MRRVRRTRSALGTLALASAVMATLAGRPDCARAQGAGATPARPSPVAAANTAFAAAESRLAKHDTAAALASLMQAIEADPEYLRAHEKFIEVERASLVKKTTDIDEVFRRVEAAIAALAKQYGTWAARFPNSAGVQYGFGTIYVNEEDPRARPYLLEAVRLDPTLAKAYQALSIDAQRWGNNAESLEYIGKAAAADPASADYAASYAFAFQYVDAVRYRALSLDVVNRFPATERGAQMLYWLGVRASNDAERIGYLERLRAQFAPAKFSWSSSGMYELFEAYERTAPEKARILAGEIRRNAKGRDTTDWAKRDTLAGRLIEARRHLAAHRYREASAALGPAVLERYTTNGSMLALLKAEAAAGSGDVRTAYDTLVARFARTPSDDVREALAAYGAKLGKSALAFETDVQSVRDKAAKPAPPFRLGLYTSADSASLADFRGKVVLVTFWFPGCGPCRGEFPHMQNVIDKFKGRNVAYLGMNVVPEQDAYVLSFMKGTRYTFTPLRTTSKWAMDTYKVRGEPTNFLIDQTGRIAYSGFRIEQNNERELELMIESLLNHPPDGAGSR